MRFRCVAHPVWPSTVIPALEWLWPNCSASTCVRACGTWPSASSTCMTVHRPQGARPCHQVEGCAARQRARLAGTAAPGRVHLQRPCDSGAGPAALRPDRRWRSRAPRRCMASTKESARTTFILGGRTVGMSLPDRSCVCLLVKVQVHLSMILEPPRLPGTLRLPRRRSRPLSGVLCLVQRPAPPLGHRLHDAAQRPPRPCPGAARRSPGRS
jgi:hypothetical protein